MNDIMKQIKQRRVDGDISQTMLGDAIGRSQWFVSMLERGAISVDHETAAKILAAIDRLSEFKRQAKEKKATEFADLRLKTRVELANGAPRRGTSHFANRKPSTHGRALAGAAR